jgi:nitroreductase
MSTSPIHQILELARWAPSGDNTQPWRFDVSADDRAVVHAQDTRANCVYDFKGRASQLALGALFETIHIAASHIGYRATITSEADLTRAQTQHEIVLHPDSTLQPDPLFETITQRSVQRRPLSTRALTPEQKHALEQAAAPYTLRWIEPTGQRLSMARLLFASAKLRLIAPEAYAVHRSIIAWRSQYSEDKVPDQAIGLDPLTLRLMEWVMHSWERVRFFNHYLAGTYAPRLQLDLLPGLACAAHFALLSPHPPRQPEDFIAAGRAVQRFWLTATQLGLQLQPEMTPLIFCWYHDNGEQFSQIDAVQSALPTIRNRLSNVMGAAVPDRGVFVGRIGWGKPATSRSHRLPVEYLIRS